MTFIVARRARSVLLYSFNMLANPNAILQQAWIFWRGTHRTALYVRIAPQCPSFPPPLGCLSCQLLDRVDSSFRAPHTDVTVFNASLGVHISHARIVGPFYLQIRKFIVEFSEAGWATHGAEDLPYISAQETRSWAPSQRRRCRPVTLPGRCAPSTRVGCVHQHCSLRASRIGCLRTFSTTVLCALGYRIPSTVPRRVSSKAARTRYSRPTRGQSSALASPCSTRLQGGRVAARPSVVVPRRAGGCGVPRGFTSCTNHCIFHDTAATW